MHRRSVYWRLAGLILALLLSASRPAVAETEIDEMDLQQLGDLKVSGVSRFEQPLSNAPATVTVITAEEIKRHGYRNLAEILGTVRGFTVTSDRNYTYVGVRGFGRTGDYNTRILTLVDGHRVNENMYDLSYYAHEFILDLDLIERIEFIRGPASAVYGDNAFFGVVNVITRKAKAIGGTELSGSVGSLETYTGRTTYGNRFQNGLEMVLSASLLDSAGERSYYLPAFDDPATNNGVARNLDGENNYRLFSRFNFGDFFLESAYVQRKKEVPTAPFGAVFDQSPAFTVDRRAFVNLRFDHTYGGTLTIMGRLFYDYYSYYGDFSYPTGGDPATYINRDAAYNQWVGAELQGSYPLSSTNLLLAGVEYQHNLQQKFRNYDLDPHYRYLEADDPSRRAALFLQDEQTLFSDLIVNAGVRLDWFSTFGTTINPRAALIYKPFTGTTGKLLYGEAFRAPNNFELYYEVPVFFYQANPDLDPERIRSYEVVLEQALGNNMRLTASGFLNQIRNLITQETDPATDMRMFVNKSSAEARGGEVELEGKWANGWEGRASYTYQKVTDGETGLWMENSPHHLAVASLSVPLFGETLSAGPELQYVGRRLGRNRHPVGGLVLTNLTLFSKKLLPGLELSGSIYNLFDKEYGGPATDDHEAAIQTIPQDGRTFRGKVTWAF